MWGKFLLHILNSKVFFKGLRFQYLVLKAHSILGCGAVKSNRDVPNHQQTTICLLSSKSICLWFLFSAWFVKRSEHWSHQKRNVRTCTYLTQFNTKSRALLSHFFILSITVTRCNIWECSSRLSIRTTMLPKAEAAITSQTKTARNPKVPRISSKIIWLSEISQQIYDLVESCRVCAETKGFPHPKPLIPTDISSYRW